MDAFHQKYQIRNHALYEQLLQKNSHITYNDQKEISIQDTTTKLSHPSGNETKTLLWISLKDYLIHNNYISDPISVPELLVLMRWCCIALQKMHRESVVHLGLDLESIQFQIEKQNQAKILDARMTNFYYAQTLNMRNARVQARDISLPQNISTLKYTSPELIQGLKMDYVDFRSDIYSLGCIFYKLATGDDVYITNSRDDLLDAHCFSEATPITMKHSTFPCNLQSLILKMLCKSIDQRFSSLGPILVHITTFQVDQAALLDTDQNLETRFVPIQPIVYNESNDAQMLLPSTNHYVFPRIKHLERMFQKVRGGHPMVLLLTGTGKEETFHAFTSHYSNTCITATAMIRDGVVAHKPLVSLVQQVTDHLFKLPKDQFSIFCQEIYSKFRYSCRMLISIIPELKDLFSNTYSFQTTLQDFEATGNESPSTEHCTQYLKVVTPDPEISNAIINTLIAYLEIFCSNGRCLCIYIDNIHLAGNYFWKVFSNLLTKELNFMLLGGSGDSKEDSALLNANFNHLKKLGIQVNNYELDAPKVSILRSLIQATLVGLPGALGEVNNMVVTPSKISTFRSSQVSDTKFQTFSDNLILKCANDPLMIGEMMYFLKNKGAIVLNKNISQISNQLWIPNWNQAHALLSSLKSDIISYNISNVSASLKQLLEIASVLEIPFTIDSMTRYTNRDTHSIFSDIHNALRDGWLIRYGSAFQFSSILYSKAFFNGIDKVTQKFYLNIIIRDALEMKNGETILHKSELIYDVLKWLQQYFAISTHLGRPTLLQAVKEYINDFASLTSFACRRLLMTNLPKTANNFIFHVHEVLKDVPFDLKPDIQFDLDLVHCHIQFALGNFRRVHQECMKLVNISNDVPSKDFMKVLALLLISSLACQEHSPVLTLFFAHMHRIKHLSNLVLTEQSIRNAIQEKYRLIEPVLLKFESEHKISKYFQDESPNPETDHLVSQVKVIIEAEAHFHDRPDLHILLGLTAMQYILEAKRNRMHNSVILAYGLYALRALSNHAIDGISMKLTNTHFSSLVHYIKSSQQKELCLPLRYAVKRDRILIAVLTEHSFGQQHHTLNHLKRVSIDCKEPTILLHLQELFISVLSGINIGTILSSLPRLEATTKDSFMHLNLILETVKTYAEALSNFEEEHLTNNSESDGISPIPSKERRMSFTFNVSSPMTRDFMPIVEDYHKMFTSIFGQFIHALLASLYFMMKKQFEDAFYHIQKVIEFRRVFAGNIIFVMLPFFIVNICSEYISTTSKESLKRKAIEIIAQQVQISQYWYCDIGQCVHFYCRAIYLKYSSKEISLQLVQLLQKSLQIAHRFEFQFVIGVVSLNLVSLFQDLEFAETIVNSTLLDGLHSWSKIGASIYLEDIRKRYDVIIQNLKGKDDSPIIFLSSKAKKKVMGQRKNINDYITQTLTQAGVTSIQNSDKVINTQMIVAIICIQQYEKIINHNMTSEMVNLLTDYYQIAKSILQRYFAVYEMGMNGRIIAYFPSCKVNALSAIINIHNEVKIRQENEVKPNSVSLLLSTSVSLTNVLITSPTSWIENELGRIDSNFSPVFCPDFDELLLQAKLVSSFNIPIVLSESIHQLVSNSTDSLKVGMLYLGRFQVEQGNKETSKETVSSLYELYSLDWENVTKIQEFGEGIQLFKNRKFIAASNFFSQITKSSQFTDSSQDKLARFYIDVCRLYKQLQLGADWNGEILINKQLVPLPLRNQGSLYYLQRGIVNSLRENDESSSSDVLMLQQQLDYKISTLSSLHETLTHKEESISELNFQNQQYEKENKSLRTEVNQLIAKLAKEKKNRLNIERKYLALRNCNGAMIGGRIPVPSKLLFLASPAKETSGTAKVHPIFNQKEKSNNDHDIQHTHK